MPVWRHEIKVKQYLTHEDSDQAVHQFVTNTLPKLKYILRREERRTEKGDNRALYVLFLDDFKMVVENFEWIKESIENGEDPTEYDFNSWVDALNEYLDCLYDIGDTVTISRDSRINDEKFLWVS
ncbi:hypothetical protein [Bacillus haynesii]|uniref:hypothetical protein n=1 Tax=Bacillus haynesii TaxID=1925021 RepID=UPI00227FC8BA|nr:hypothetical protein [Bacillus haynesii]MCY9156262.1 hypothetical protein [Bacillus haynesii]MCY9450347.1 hypothetical protein [Bacillus haynesii]